MSRLLLLGLLLIGTARAQTPPAESLRVMSFNVRNSGAHDGINAWAHRKEPFFATIHAFDPDLIGFQEVLQDQHDDIVREMPGYGFTGVPRDDGKQKGERAMLGYRSSKFTRLDSGDFWLSEQPTVPGSRSWGAGYSRICSWAMLRDAAGRTLFYANTHLDNKSAPARANAARLIVARLQVLARGTRVILTGDFNATEDDDCYRIIHEGPAPDAGAYIDSFREVFPQRGQDEASFHAFHATTGGSRIDFIWHSGAFRAVSAQIDRSHIAHGVCPSDHYPVTAVLVPAAP